MIYVTGAPRTGTTFVMEVLHHLGYRVDHWFDPKFRCGNENARFNNLAQKLFPVYGFQPPEKCGYVVEHGFAYAGEVLSADDLITTFQSIFEDQDAIKDCYGAHTLAIMCHLGLRPGHVIVTMRDSSELLDKYHVTTVGCAQGLSYPVFHHAIYGLILDTCSYFGLPFVVVRNPHKKEQWQSLLGSLYHLLGVRGFEEIGEAINKAYVERPENYFGKEPDATGA